MVIDLDIEKQKLLERRKLLESSSFTQNYPSALKRDIICDAYAMSCLWSLILDKKSTNSEIKKHNIDSRYTLLRQEVFHKYDTDSDSIYYTRIGGLNTSKLDALTTVASNDLELIEELEFAFLYFELCFYCVRIWMTAQTTHGQNVIIEVRNEGPIEVPDIDNYDAAIYFFGINLIQNYLQRSLRDMRAYFNFEFPEDQFSHRTSNIIEYINNTPQLIDFIRNHPQYTSIFALLKEYAVKYQKDPALIHRVDKLKDVVYLIEKEQSYLNIIEERKKILDDHDLHQYSNISCNLVIMQQCLYRDSLHNCNSLHDVKRLFRSNLKDVQLEQLISNEHPYVCSLVAADCFEQEMWSDGFVFLQKSLFWTFSYPNPFLHNKEAICGCADALLMFRQLLFLDNCDSFEQHTGVSLFHILYFYLKRAIVLCQMNLPYARMDIEEIPVDVIRIILYEVDLAELIEEFSEILTEDGLCEKDVFRIAETHRASARKLLEDWGLFMLSMSLEGDWSTNFGDFRYAESIMMIYEGEIAYSYNRGFYRIEESIVANCIQQLTRQYTSNSNDIPTVKVSSDDQRIIFHRDLSESQQDQVRIATKKCDISNFRSFFDMNGIKVLYHFTDRENLPNIRKYGLLSFDYIRRKGIVSSTGGDDKLQSVDQSFHNEDYIHLSFVKRHPMGWRLKRENQNRDFIILKISPEVAYSESTIFSDINAANPNHTQGPDFSVLKKVNMASVNSKYSQQNSEEQEQKAAEILVRRTIPINYILNLDSPETF